MASTIEIRKYPNRRYYNTKDSRHVTLEEIRDLVRDGHDIKIVDSRTDVDITVAVLTQILLEIESPKLAFLPVNFLQHLIRMNTGALKMMTESYFRNTMAAFVQASESAKSEATGPSGIPFADAMQDWQQVWSGMMPKTPRTEASTADPEPDATDRVAELSRQIEEMRRILEQLQKKVRK